jgi:hypothetical protein
MCEMLSSDELSNGMTFILKRVTEMEAERVRRSDRCIVIHTTAVNAQEIDPPMHAAKPLQPDWENDGGAIAAAVQERHQVGGDQLTAS